MINLSHHILNEKFTSLEIESVMIVMLACPICKNEKITLNQNLNTKGSSPHTIYLQAKCEKCGQALVIELTPTKVQAQYID